MIFLRYVYTHVTMKIFTCLRKCENIYFMLDLGSPSRGWEEMLFQVLLSGMRGCSGRASLHPNTCLVLLQFKADLIVRIQRNRTNSIYREIYKRRFIVGIGAHYNGGHDVPGSAISKLENQESWWCNSIWVQKPENQERQRYNFQSESKG